MAASRALVAFARGHSPPYARGLVWAVLYIFSSLLQSLIAHAAPRQTLVVKEREFLHILRVHNTNLSGNATVPFAFTSIKARSTE